jgi:serine/threonine protein kinase
MTIIKSISYVSSFLEYVPGGSVGSYLLKHGRFDENVTKSFTRQILDGLRYLHSKGILHGVRLSLSTVYTV